MFSSHLVYYFWEFLGEEERAHLVERNGEDSVAGWVRLGAEGARTGWLSGNN